MKRFFLVIISLSLSINIFSQTPSNSDANIFGDVKSGGTHIPFVTIIVDGTNIVTTTDATGHYKLVNLIPGEHIIIVQSFGYLKKEQKIIVEKGKTVELNFDLEEDLIGIEEVVVSSDRDAVDRKSSGVIVNSINTQVFSLINSVSLSEGIDFTPGMRTESNCQNCGFTQIRMNGMEGPYSQVLINSRPIFSGLAGVYGLELFPSNMIEKVEVVRGGGSALYGGNAIAGTINIITKEPITNSFGLSTNYNAVGIGHEESEKLVFDRSINFNGSIISDDLKSGLSIFGMVRNRDPYDDNGDGFSEEVLLKNQTVGISTFYKPTIRTKISLDLYKIHEFRRGGDQFDKLPHETLITEQLEHDIIGGNLGLDILTKSTNKFAFYAAGQTVDRNSYYGAEGDPTAYGETNDISTSTGFQYSGKFNFISDSKIIAGIDYAFNKLKDVKLGVGGEDNIVISNQMVNTIGSFFQYDLKFNKFKISAGVRYDNYQIADKSDDHADMNGNAIIPRANILINIADNLQFRTSYARGYRAPQIFDEDLHIETSGLRRITHENSSDLIQENSDSFSGSLIFDNIFGSKNPVQVEFIAEGFYTKLNNPFVSEMSEPDEFGNIVFLRMNAEKGAYVYGVNLEMNVAFSKQLITQFGFTQQKSLYEEPQKWGEEEDNVSEYYVRTPDSYGFFTAQYEPFHSFNIALTGTYTGKMYVPHLGAVYGDSPDIDDAIDAGDIIKGEKLERIDEFLNMGIKISYDLHLKNNYKVRFNVGMQNILDQTQYDHDSGVFRDAGYIYGPHKSRSIFFGIEIGTGI